MFHSTVMRRPSEELPLDDAASRLRNGADSTYARSPPAPTAHSPFSPNTNGVPPRPQHNQYQPSTPLPMPTPTPGQPSNSNIILGSPSIDTPRERSSTYYDPTRPDTTERRPTESPSMKRESYVTPHSTGILPKFYGNASYTSPEVNNFHSPPLSHSHPASNVSHSPQLSAMSPHNGVGIGMVKREVSVKQEPVAATPTRKADPMSFSSILSDAEPPQPSPSTSMPKPRKPSRQSNHNPEVMSRTSSRQSSAAPQHTPTSRVPAKRKANGETKTSPKNARQKTNPKPLSKDEEKAIQAAMAKIDAEASDIDLPEFEEQKKVYKAKSLKRKLAIEATEISKAKLRRKDFSDKMAARLGKHAHLGELRYHDLHGEEAYTVVQEKEVEAEKERKKEMQRKRRRERTLASQVEQTEVLFNKARMAENEDERQRLMREAQRAEKKAQQTKVILARGEKGPEIRAVSPVEPNLSGGAMDSFPVDEPKKTKRGGARPRKSKEQKQAEKDSAEAAQAAIDKGEDVVMTPSEEHKEPRIKIKLSTKEKSEESLAPVEPYSTKGYNQIYEQIWRDLARKDVGKVYKLAADCNAIRSSNLKKTAILASKEAKRWQLRTNKGTKDLQARCKRVMREMLQFWKRNEKDERDLRRAAEKQEIEDAKKAEADREANRQKRKLNFLIQQTELYSHFIGKKIKTDEVERSTDHPDLATTKESAASADMPEHTGPAPAKVTNFEDLDFDAEDDSVLKAAAMANAQNAIQEAQNKARAFNKQDAPDLDEEGELNFQNPTGMGDVDIEQPSMLQAQLKEYQLKGLNWLVNLYEQGINGILADEMGLGKTVQSISVMAYLAEKHNIWGPFIVVAPASTLHNWQQEISRFVPKLKIVPYWGTANDRKVLRKFWDRKKITYTEDSPFHVLITSYQIVVSDVAYLQKMKWQYMILDEAQAIKSSSSSRWKSLLNFHCRNRLLLTGTPIQNNMQELWALLHFIMPTLFDSHDEFSEWFSKDIESHAQTNTKLNEDQLKRLHMILKPFMLRRVKKHVQKELGDKIEIDLYCDLTYAQRKIYSGLRDKISLQEIFEKSTMGDAKDQDSLMNLVMQFRKVCNHPELFEPATIRSPFSFARFAETGSYLREGNPIPAAYSVKNLIEYPLPRLIWREDGRLRSPGRRNDKAGFKGNYLDHMLNIWSADNVQKSQDTFSWLRFADVSAGEASSAFRKDIFNRAVDLAGKPDRMAAFQVAYDDEDENYVPPHAMLRVVDRQDRKPLADMTDEGHLSNLMNVSRTVLSDEGLGRFEQCAIPKSTAPPIDVYCSSSGTVIEKENTIYNIPMRRTLYGPSPNAEAALISSKLPPSYYPPTRMLPSPEAEKKGFTPIQVPPRMRLVSDCGKLAKLDALLHKLKEGGHRVLLYFQMVKMIDLMEEYLTYRGYRYLRLDGSTKLEDRRDTVHDFQTRPEIFIFLLSTRAGGLGINLTAADTVIFYDSDWNPTIDSQAMDRSHRLGQTKQVTVYRMITRGTIEERIRKRALQKEEVQKVVMTGGSSGGVDFNARRGENKAKEVAMWLVDEEGQEELQRLEERRREEEAKMPVGRKGGKLGGKKRKAAAGGGGGERSLEDFYHEGEGHFDDTSASARPSGTATPVDDGGPSSKRLKTGAGAASRGGKKGTTKRAKTARQRFAMADGGLD